MGNEKGWNGFKFEYPPCNGPCGEEYNNWCESCKEAEKVAWDKEQAYLASKKKNS